MDLKKHFKYGKFNLYDISYKYYNIYNLQVLINDCATNAHLSGEGVIDKLMSIARSMVISNNVQYTRVSTRTCQLIIAIASNSEAVYPYHLTSVIISSKIM